MARRPSTAARRAGLDAAEHDGTLDEPERPLRLPVAATVGLAEARRRRAPRRWPQNAGEPRSAAKEGRKPGNRIRTRMPVPDFTASSAEPLPMGLLRACGAKGSHGAGAGAGRAHGKAGCRKRTAAAGLTTGAPPQPTESGRDSLLSIHESVGSPAGVIGISSRRPRLRRARVARYQSVCGFARSARFQRSRGASVAPLPRLPSPRSSRSIRPRTSECRDPMPGWDSSLRVPKHQPTSTHSSSPDQPSTMRWLHRGSK